MTYTHELTALETACGVTLENVATYLQRGAFFDNGRAWYTDCESPALAMSVARCAFGGQAVRYVGVNQFGYSVYRLDTSR